MPQKRDFQREQDALVHTLRAEGRRPRLLIQTCCAPCGSYCLSALCTDFDVTAYFYNPNISPETEYRFRLAELRRLLEEMPLPAPVALFEGPYDPERFLAAARGLEAEPERGRRCYACYRLRLWQTAQAAKEGGYDYFCTTLSISPHKNAVWLNELGEEAAQKVGVAWLPSDFKKNEGYKKSIEYSKKYNLYRQNYCGCVFSRQEAQRRAEAADPPAKP